MPPTNTPAINASITDTNPQPVPSSPYIIICVTNPIPGAGYNVFASTNAAGTNWLLYGSTVDTFFAVTSTNYSRLFFRESAVMFPTNGQSMFHP
ncbi:MAG TPA: hypothetical protein VGJ73_21200 [Verrucomicrobiae bacterium]|jgi:hypothetical protein